MSVGQPQSMLLNQFGMTVREVFGVVAYHVGSSLTSKDGWRDVDVRCILSDEQWNALSLGDKELYHHSAKWRALCIVFSEYGRHTTGLPIDFQIQHADVANRDYTGPRSALVVSNMETP